MAQGTFNLDADGERIEAFVAQSDEYLASAMQEFPDDSAATIESVLACEPRPLFPVVVEDPTAVSEKQRGELRSQYFGPYGVAHFTVPAAHSAKRRHLILELAEHLASDLPLAFPVDHPMEQHAEAGKRFGEPDGTLKLYNLEIPEHIDKYREQAETKEMFAAHNDGLGYGGAIAASMIVLDSPPAWGGYTCFQQFVRVSLALANDDPEAFRSLFIPDAIVALRPRGKGAIRVTSPVLYVNDRGEPQTFFRVSSGEYRITWRADIPSLARARELLLKLAQPFAPSSTFVHLMHPGEGVIIRNTQVVHSRTPFEDDVYGTKRVLARKWFVPTPSDQQYKHVPGMNVHPRYAKLFPELFAPELLQGEWHYDPQTDDNVLVTTADQ
jgi:hypothetical protein